MTDNREKKDRAAELRRKAETKVSSQPNPTGEIDAKRLLHELQVHQIELEMQNEELEMQNEALEMQNEELRQTQGKLAESRNHYAELYDFAPVGYVTLSDAGLIMEANLTLARKLDLDRQKLVNRLFSALICPDDQDVYCQHRRKVIETQQRDSCQLRLLRGDAESLWVEIDSILIEGKGDNNPCLRTIISDISVKKKLQEKHIRTSHLAALGELAAGMAHEINNPITGVINYAQLLLNKHPEDDREREMLSHIIKEGNRIATIVHNLLGFARKERDVKASLKVEEIVNESLQLVLMQLDHDGISVDVVIADGLPKIIGNRQKLGQVMLNMISNARYALNQKYPEKHADKVLQISAQQVAYDGEKRLRLALLDHGCGVAKKHMEKLFTPFFTTKAAGVGTGLGLSVSYDILLEHGATVHVESDVGQFTNFVIEFPAANEAS